MAPGDLVKGDLVKGGLVESGAEKDLEAAEAVETPEGSPQTPVGRREDDELAHGTAVVNVSRVSVARHLRVQEPALPFTPQQLARLDEALTFAGRETGVAFSVYLGELGEDTRARAEQMFAGLGSAAPGAVLIAVSPGERVVELVTGSSVQRRVTDRAARLAVTAMVASFREGDLAGGLVSALRMLADQAGPAGH